MWQVSVSRQDNSPVLMNDRTKWITIEKTMRMCSVPVPFDQFGGTLFSYYTQPKQFVHAPCGSDTQKSFKLNENGTTNIEMPTLENETNFNLNVRN